MIRRELEDVFRFVATEFFDNYLKWSPEVCQLEKLTAGEMRVGVKARQVRLDAGYRSEALFQVVDFKPDQVLRFTSLSKPRFEVCYRFEHVAADTRLSFDFRADLPLYLLPLSGYIEKIIGQSGRRVVANLKTMLEADAESTMKRKPGS
ncbi:MAG: SRPBCC family protein [Gammaproteobacteria bacterium]